MWAGGARLPSDPQTPTPGSDDALTCSVFAFPTDNDVVPVLCQAGRQVSRHDSQVPVLGPVNTCRRMLGMTPEDGTCSAAHGLQGHVRVRLPRPRVGGQASPPTGFLGLRRVTQQWPKVSRIQAPCSAGSGLGSRAATPVWAQLPASQGRGAIF